LSVWGSSIAHAAEQAVTTSYDFVERKVEQKISDVDLKRFNEAFPDLIDEELLGDFVCAVLSNKSAVNGHVQITRASLCFAGSGMKFSMKLAEIVSVQRAVSLPTRDNASPCIVPVPTQLVIPSALQIYSFNDELHQFLNFGGALQSSVQCLEDAYTILDHAWREAAPVPNPSYTYA